MKTGHLTHIIYTITVIVHQVTLLSRNQFCLCQYQVLLTQPKRLPTTVDFEVYPTVTLSVHFQRCGSGSEFFHPGSRILGQKRTWYGTVLQHENSVFLTQKTFTKLSEILSGMTIPNPRPRSRIRIPGMKNHLILDLDLQH